MNFLSLSRNRRLGRPLAVFGLFLFVPGTVRGQAPVVPPEVLPQPDARFVLRSIGDPSSGIRWLLLADHPGGPGRLVPVPDPSVRNPAANPAAAVPVAPGAGTKQCAVPTAGPVIRAGETLLLESHTGAVDAWLEAVAVAPAQAGASFPVRLKLGGALVRAIAVGPGRATPAPGREGWTR